MTRVYKTTYEDIYKLHANFGRVPPPNRNEKYWESLVSEIGAYSKTHNDKFTTDLLIAVINELEREYQEAGRNDE